MKASKKPALPKLIGVIHLPPLAGAPGARDLHPAEALQMAGTWAVNEAKVLEKAGFTGIILENFGDVPFFRNRVPPETVASLAIIAAAVREGSRLPIGINVLRNDSRAALAIASVVGADFIRVNVLSGVSATDQGLIEGDAAELLRERDRLGVDVRILADARVKHARSLSSSDIAREVEEVALRAGADGVILTGATTGRLIDGKRLARAEAAARASGISLWIGSGATRESIGEIRMRGHGVIVGSALRKGGIAGAPLDAKRVQNFVAAYRAGIPKKKSTQAQAKAASKTPSRKARVQKKSRK